MSSKSIHDELETVLKASYNSIDSRVRAIGEFTNKHIIPIFSGSLESKLIDGPATWFHAETSQDPALKSLDLHHGIDLFVSGSTRKQTAMADKVGFGLRVHWVPPGYAPHQQFTIRTTTNSGNQTNSEYQKRLQQVGGSGTYNDYTFEFYLESNDRLHWAMAKTDQLIAHVSSSLATQLITPITSTYGYQYVPVEWAAYKSAGNDIYTGSVRLK